MNEALPTGEGGLADAMRREEMRGSAGKCVSAKKLFCRHIWVHDAKIYMITLLITAIYGSIKFQKFIDKHREFI